MEVHFSPDFDELEEMRETLDSCYDDIERGKVKLIDGEEFFGSLRQREAERIKSSSPR